MSLRRRLRVLEQSDMIVIPQRSGPPARFPREAYAEAFVNAMDRLKGGADVPPRHPLLDAARNSSDYSWREVFFADIDVVDHESNVIDEIEDLSEGATEGGGGS
jgi:hypothetical protein